VVTFAEAMLGKPGPVPAWQVRQYCRCSGYTVCSNAGTLSSARAGAAVRSSAGSALERARRRARDELDRIIVVSWAAY
jgi:hypothetical protein